MAPELFYWEPVEGQSKEPRMRKAADIYALGMLIYEVQFFVASSKGKRINEIIIQVLCGKRPFNEVHREVIMYKVFCGQRPERLSSIPDPTWKMLEACWRKEPTERPTLEAITAMCGFYTSEDAWTLPPSPTLTPPTNTVAFSGLARLSPVHPIPLCLLEVGKPLRGLDEVVQVSVWVESMAPSASSFRT